MLGKIEGRKRRGRQKMKWLDDITNSMDMSLSKLWEMVKDQGSQACCSPWNLKESDVTEQLNSKLFSLAFTHLSISVYWNSKISNGLYSYWYGWIQFRNFLICPFFFSLQSLFLDFFFFFGVFLVFHFITQLFGYMCVCFI